MRTLLFLLAWVSFVLGVIGAFIPILPTTPFLILSAYLFSKSSPRFHAWILNLPMAGPAVQDWHDNRVIKPKAKILCALMISLSLIPLWISAKIYLALKVGVTLLLVGVASFVLSQKSYPD